ncbi:hypothetical protein DFH09DRAFT_1188324 [Mycena vulgaris]|nr:hypothetical protein DFH09DRAFT_1188324 [Mycena vulgaris]
MVQGKLFDDNLASAFNSDLDPLLIFAGLFFPAILTAFLIEIRKGLQEDLQSVTNMLLMILIARQHNTSATQTPSFPLFQPTSTTRWGWVTQFSSTVSGSNWGDVRLHCSRFRGLRRWHLKLIVQCLPILIHISFFLFSVGLVTLLFSDDRTIGITICILMLPIAVLYIASSIHPAFYPDSPFRTPVSGMIRHLLHGSIYFTPFARFPDREDAQQAQALAWLLTESQDGPTIDAAVQAIAGLPMNPRVQDQLLCRQTVDILSKILLADPSAEVIDKSKPDLFGACLYALLHWPLSGPS